MIAEGSDCISGRTDEPFLPSEGIKRMSEVYAKMRLISPICSGSPQDHETIKRERERPLPGAFPDAVGVKPQILGASNSP